MYAFHSELDTPKTFKQESNSWTLSQYCFTPIPWGYTLIAKSFERPFQSDVHVRVDD